jgi:hypothetical protein
MTQTGVCSCRLEILTKFNLFAIQFQNPLWIFLSVTFVLTMLVFVFAML